MQYNTKYKEKQKTFFTNKYLSRFHTGCQANMGDDIDDSGKLFDIDFANIYVIVRMENRLHRFCNTMANTISCL